MIEVNLSDAQLEWCGKHAKEIVDHYGGDNTRGSGSYNHNKISSNLGWLKLGCFYSINIKILLCL